MTIDTKALRERLPSFDFYVAEMCGYTCGSEMVSAADGEYVLAADAHERLEAAADRLAALEAENQRLTNHLRAIAANSGFGAARNYAEHALSQPAEQAPLMIRCQVCEHHTPVVFEPEPARREGS